MLVFAKAPEPGTVKTRLIPALGAEACARLYRSLVEHTLQTATEAALCPVQLWCAPAPSNGFFRDCARRFKVALRTQRGPDLGMRMAHALASTLVRSEFAVIIGCDCPTLNGSYLNQACEALTARVQVVIGPAEDGGYVLIGARRPITAVFTDVEWGTARVLDQTRAQLRSCGLPWRELAPLWDIDRPEDLVRLAAAGLEMGGAPSLPTTPASLPGSADSRARA